jgi:hypothetical protein
VDTEEKGKLKINIDKNRKKKRNVETNRRSYGRILIRR